MVTLGEGMGRSWKVAGEGLLGTGDVLFLDQGAGYTGVFSL